MISIIPFTTPQGGLKTWGLDMRGRLLKSSFDTLPPNGAVMISCQGRVIKVLSPQKASAFLQQAQAADSQQLQLLMAKEWTL